MDGLNRLEPARMAEFLDALRVFFDCPGCIFLVGADREAVIRGRQEAGGRKDGGVYFDRLFRMTFRVPQNSFSIQKYITDNLARVNLAPTDPEEQRHYEALASLSVGHDPKALERLFHSFLFLKSMAGEEAFASRERRLALFALLCMQSRFPVAYRLLAAEMERLSPEFLMALASGSALEEQAGLDDMEKTAFRAFAAELCSAASTDGRDGITAEECLAFRRALAISAMTSSE